MPLPDITSLQEQDTFQTLFIKNNTIIDRLNLLDVANIIAGSGITYIGPNAVGGITLSLDLSIIEDIGFKVQNIVPSGLTLGSPIGITGTTFGTVSNLSVGSSRNYLGIISKLYSDGYRITTSGRIITGATLSDNTLYYLGNGGITSTIPTSNGQVVKPVLFSIGLTYGAIVLNQKETLISESSSYIKSASRVIAEIPSNSGFSAGNIVFYDVVGSTWAKSNANAHNRSEVFGVIESISGATATVVTHGSVTIPSTMFHDMGQTGGSGGNDIWFLSGTTAGHLQNLGPTLPDHIIKPIYYAYPHEFSGATFSGLVVNYIGYSTASVSSSSTSIVIPVYSIFADVKSYKTGGVYDYTNYCIDGQLIYTNSSYDAPLIIFSTSIPLFSSISRFTNVTKYDGLIAKFTKSTLYKFGYIAEVVFTNNLSINTNILLDATVIGKIIAKIGITHLIHILPNTTGAYVPSSINGEDVTMTTITGSVITETLNITSNNVYGYVLPNYGSAPYWLMKLE